MAGFVSNISKEQLIQVLLSSRAGVQPGQFDPAPRGYPLCSTYGSQDSFQGSGWDHSCVQPPNPTNWSQPLHPRQSLSRMWMDTLGVSHLGMKGCSLVLSLQLVVWVMAMFSRPRLKPSVWGGGPGSTVHMQNLLSCVTFCREMVGQSCSTGSGIDPRWDQASTHSRPLPPVKQVPTWKLGVHHSSTPWKTPHSRWGVTESLSQKSEIYGELISGWERPFWTLFQKKKSKTVTIKKFKTFDWTQPPLY